MRPDNDRAARSNQSMVKPFQDGRVSGTRTIRCDLASGVPAMLDRELRANVAAMPRKIRGVPKAFRNFAYAVTQTEKRLKPAGQLPDYAVACVRSGVPTADAIRPLSELIGFIASHAPRIRCMATALENHTKEAGEAANAAMRLQKMADKPTPAAVDEWIREAEELKVALDEALECAYALKYGKAK